MATAKTNAVRLLDRLGVPFELREYEVDPDDLAAETVARKVGLPPEQVFKTLVARGDKHGVCLAVVPGNCELDLKALAKATGDKKIDTVPLKEVEPLTGYVRGGVTALACKKPYPVYLDESASLFDRISISAGLRGLQVLIAPDDYIRATRAIVAPIARDKATGECKPTLQGSIPPCPMMRESRSTDHRLAVRVGHTHGRLGRTPRLLDPVRGQPPHRIPTPLVPGRGRRRTLLRQRPPGRAPLRLGA